MSGERRPRFWRPLWRGIPGVEKPFPFFRWLNPFVSIVVDEPGPCAENGYLFSISFHSLMKHPVIWLRLWYWEIFISLDGLRGIGPKSWYWRWWRRNSEGWSTMGRWE
jgi:hypothetical protein